MISRKWVLAVAAAGALATGVAACGSDDNGGGGGNAPGGTINGAGATFPQPVYDEFANQIGSDEDITVNYQAIGSGGGVAQFTAGTVDFGASDPPMTNGEVKKAEDEAGTAVVHVPSVLGAVTVSYNVSGVDKGLKLDGQTVADVFLGKITKWNDPAIAKLNPDVDLPDTDITVAHRSDESGTTKLFTTFLSDYSSEWKNDVGADTTVKWPTGTGAKGNDGVAGVISKTDGAFGYVEQAFALQNDFTTADVKNADGNYIAPTLESTTEAGNNITIPDDLRLNLINSPGEKTYPIASDTNLLVYQDMCKAGVDETAAKNVQGWLNFVLDQGQDIAPDLDYAPLPDKLREAAQQKVDDLQCNGKALSG